MPSGGSGWAKRADDVAGLPYSYTVYSAAEVPPFVPGPTGAKAATQAARPARDDAEAVIEIPPFAPPTEH
jgi:hypothetical protein